MDKDLSRWGREKARSRYDGGGAVPLPKPRPDIEGAARQELGRRMRDSGTFQMPDNQSNKWMPYATPESDRAARERQDATSGMQNIKRGGRIK